MPFTSFAEARDELIDHIKTEWNLQASPPPLYYDDKYRDLPVTNPLTPTNTPEYCRLHIEHFSDNQRTLGGIGQRRYEQTGIIVLMLFTRPGDGLSKLDSLAKIAVDIFKGRSTGSDRVLFTRSRYNEIGVIGAWRQGNVTVDFVYDLIA